MAKWKTPKDVEDDIRDMIRSGATQREIASRHGVGTSAIARIKKEMQEGPSGVYQKPETEKVVERNQCIVTVKSLDIKTVEQLIATSDIDMTVWEVDRYVVNSWEVTMKLRDGNSDNPQTYTNYQVKAWFKRKTPEIRSLELLLGEIKKHGPVKPLKIRVCRQPKHRRVCEISLLDPHLGLRAFRPASDMAWTPEKCEEIMFCMLERLFELVKQYGPFEKVLFPFGNDYLHADTVFHTTTEGTSQPEMDSWHETFLRGEKLAIRIVDRMKQVAPVHIIVTVGNHARQSEFALGRLLHAYYHRDKMVEVDASPSPYKFFPYGVCLVGFEHGHSIRQTVRLAALMANETRLNGWQEARYCEWHLGDQHRKGSAKPCMMEEQGVSVEFLPGLTPPNEWHRIKSFNWQKRAGMAFIWDKAKGPIARMQVNIDNYTGELL